MDTRCIKNHEGKRAGQDAVSYTHLTLITQDAQVIPLMTKVSSFIYLPPHDWHSDTGQVGNHIEPAPRSLSKPGGLATPSFAPRS